VSSFESLTRVLGPALFVAISVIGVRLLSYWRSFLLHWRRYRRRYAVTTAHLRATGAPYIKIQITTRGSAGSTEVILRGIRNVMLLAEEDPAFYGHYVSVELITESEVQALQVEHLFAGHPVPVEALVLPKGYETPDGTKLKARGLHYAVEHRRAGWNRRPGRTFIVHYDEESVMVPSELRKLMALLATTNYQLLEGPIYYPLEYLDASVICRTMEANRPVGCFECRHVMESGVPLHLHGSNLVVDEALENMLGWDIGSLEGQPLIAEDYVFGMNAYVNAGREVFGWHGCVMLEQPPFSFRSAFKQRHRWIFGVLQGMAKVRRHPSFLQMAPWPRFTVVWGTRYRIFTFALGSITGVLSFALMPYLMWLVLGALARGQTPAVPWPASLWMAAVGAMWLGSVFIGAWYNVADAGLTPAHRGAEIARALTLAPVAGALECSAGLWAVIEWNLGRREISWQPTPKTKKADDDSNRSSTAA
jgi:hypothetical protein